MPRQPSSSRVRPGPVRVVAGLGCRRGCSRDELHDLLLACLAEAGVEPADLLALATLDSKADEPGLIALAQSLGLPLQALPGATLVAQESRLSQPSARVREITGSAGVAEAAALAGFEALGGAPARLLLDKRRSASATCALACPHHEASPP